MDEKLKMPSSSCETPYVLDSPESQPEICKQTEYISTSSTSVGENIPRVSLESMSDVKPNGVEKNEPSLPSTVDNLLYDAKSINQSIKQLLPEQNNCNKLINSLIEQINEMFKMLSNNINNPTSSTEELVQKLKSLTANRKLINAETYTNTLLSFIVKALKAIENNLHLSSFTDREMQETLTLLNVSMQKIVPKQEDHKALLKQIKKSMVKELPFLSSVDKEVVTEFNSVKDYMGRIIIELNEQYKLLKSIEEMSNSIEKNLPSQ